MSSYIDTKPGHGAQPIDVHSWADFTAQRLAWLYGEGRSETPEARADTARWQNLGRRAAA